MQGAKSSVLQEDIALFRASIDKFAGLLAGKDIKVVFRGGECHTDGQTIVLPSLETLEGLSQADQMEARKFVRNMVGYVNHEVAHVLFTDFGTWKDKAFFSKQVRAMANVIEDARVERRMTQLWRGTTANLDYYAHDVLERHAENWRHKDKFTQLCMLFSLMARGEGFEAQKRYFDPDLVDWADQVFPRFVRKAAKAQSTEQAMTMARKVCRAIREAVQEPPPPPPPQESDDEAEEEADGGGGEDEGGDDGAGLSLKHQDDGSIENEGQTQADEVTDKAAEVAQRFENLCEPISKTHTPCYSVYTTERDYIGPIQRATAQDWRCWTHQFCLPFQPDMDILCGKVGELADKAVGPLRSALTRLLRARGQAYQVRDLSQGALDRRRLWKVPVAQLVGQSPRIRRDYVHGEAHNVAVLVCVNESFSMCLNAKEPMTNGKLNFVTKPVGMSEALSRMDIAAASAMALGDVLHALDIRFGVLGHTTSLDAELRPVGTQRYKKASTRMRALYKRWGDLKIEWVKGFDERWPHRRRYIGGLHGQGNTYDGEVVRYAAQALLAQPGVSRRVCLMLDDGEPNPDMREHMWDHRYYLRHQVAWAAKQGVEVLGIGMACDLSSYYPEHVQVNELEQLPKVLLQRLTTLLRSAA